MLDTHTAALWGSQSAKLAGHPFIIHAMTTIAEPRIEPEVSTTDPNPSNDEDIEKLPEPIEDIRPDIGSLMNQWKSESTISPDQVNDSKIDELIVDEVIEEKITEELDRADAHPFGARPFKRKNYINKFLTLTESILDKKESNRFLKIVQNLRNLKSGQLHKLNIEVRKSKLKQNNKKGIF